MSRGKEATRRKLLDAARALFYEHGVRATGVAQIAKHAGVTKMTLYEHFDSKDELLLAGLREEDEVWMSWLADARKWAGPDPVKRLLSMFDLLEGWFRDDAFRGCPFVNAAIEMADGGKAVSAAAAEHVVHNLEFLAQLAREAGAIAPEELARDLLLLRDGAIVAKLVGQDAGAGRRAKRIATLLVRERLAGARDVALNART